jgi:glycosyltransferase involved in cell wall biosynthesis
MSVPLLSLIFPKPRISRASQRTILADTADTWYAFKYPDLCEPFEPLLEENFPPWVVSVAKRFGIFRGWLFFQVAKNYSFTLTTATTQAASAFLLFEALLGAPRKHLIVLQLIARAQADSRSLLKRSIYHIWLHWIFKRALRKSLMTAHVLTEWERSHYSTLFEIPMEYFVFIPLPKRRRNDRLVESLMPTSDERLVVSSGREACDWETLFKAAEGQDWRLKIICSQRDLPRVQQLNRDGIAEVLCEVSREDHQREIQKAAVYVLSLFERERSSGHVRIGDTTRAGTPIVATAVKGIEGYIDDGETGLLVPPGDAIRLRAAVNRLLVDIPYSRTLARNAFDRAANYTHEDFVDMIGLFIQRATARTIIER